MPGQTAPPPGSDPLARLTHFEKSVAGLRAGLVDLEATPSYLMLSGDGLTGATKAKLAAAAGRAEALWPLLVVVGARLDEARTIAGQGGGFLNRIDSELAECLAKPLDPVAAPGLETKRLTLAQAIGEIRDRYQAVREGASEVEALWLDVLPRIDAALATLGGLSEDEKELGVTEPLIGRARALASDLNERLVTDPLSVHANDGANLDSVVAEASRQIAGLQTGREDLADDLIEAKQLLGTLRTLRSRAVANRIESETKVKAATGLRQVPSEAIFDHAEKGLGAQLRRVTATDSWSSQRALLDLWLTSAHRLEHQLSSVESANGAPLKARETLRGRLRAYQAKMAAVGQAEDLELTGIVDAATDELFTVPTDLDRADDLIASLAERLRGRS